MTTTHPEATHHDATAGHVRHGRGPTARAVRLGLAGLPAYGILVGLGAVQPQPDPVRDPDEWARFVTGPSYLAMHLLSNLGGAILMILGSVAVAAFLSRSRAPHLALAGMVASVVGQVLLLVPGVISTFATPAVGAAYLAGHPDVMSLEFPPAMSISFVLGLLAAVTGGVLIGVAVWRSGALPRWAGAVWATSVVIFYLLGAALGMATTGASVATQPVGGLLMGVSGAAMAWAAHRGRPPGRTAASTLSTAHNRGNLR